MIFECGRRPEHRHDAYSADRALRVSGSPHSLQNFAVAATALPHDRQDASAATVRLTSTSVS
ncbi:hypothetical protein B4U45_04045 [Mycobacterium persicum]|uniref:Uncharacterized protein n=1 Tax=Mycobacterium persicum TaxID=1487726 RepID=A0A8E2LMB9_9MYCO|nr:hypothetical protein B4U45_04045 [Mycobacterium persicum]